MTTEKSYGGWYFLLIMIIIYAITFIINSKMAVSALTFFWNVIKKVIPIFILIIFLMIFTNYFVKPKLLAKYMGKGSGIKGWIIAVVAGILSSGPIYMWYPLLSDLQKQGVRNGLIATFLYNRAVKIPLLPMLIVYFGLNYSIILMIVMIIVSIVQGMVTEKAMEILK